MVILGIDPGIARTGYGVIRKLTNTNNSDFEVLEYGCIETSPQKETPQRILEIYEFLEELVRKHKVEVVSLEELFVNTNTKTAMIVSRASGAVLLLSAKYNLKFFEYTPLQIKIAVTGYGKADKAQVQQMVKLLLKLKNTPKPDDTADALAAAICHGVSL